MVTGIASTCSLIEDTVELEMEAFKDRSPLETYDEVCKGVGISKVEAFWDVLRSISMTELCFGSVVRFKDRLGNWTGIPVAPEANSEAR